MSDWRQGGGFVVRNLKMYGNSLVPGETIDLLSVGTCERLLTYVCGFKVNIEFVTVGSDSENLEFYKAYRNDNE